MTPGSEAVAARSQRPGNARPPAPLGADRRRAGLGPLAAGGSRIA